MILSYSNLRASSRAADRLVGAIEKAVAAKTVTADLAEMIPGSTTLSTSAFADALIAQL